MIGIGRKTPRYSKNQTNLGDRFVSLPLLKVLRRETSHIEVSLDQSQFVCFYWKSLNNLFNEPTTSIY